MRRIFIILCLLMVWTESALAAEKVRTNLLRLGLGSWIEGFDYEIKEKLVLNYVD